MDRRGFLAFVGAFAAGAALPKALALEKIARAPAWAKEIALYRVAIPLAAGTYTFTAYAGPEWGLFIGAVKAVGGETLFEMPVSTGVQYSNPVLSKEGLTYHFGGGEGRIPGWEQRNPIPISKA